MTEATVIQTATVAQVVAVAPTAVVQRGDRQVALIVDLTVIVTHAVPGTTAQVTSATSAEVARQALLDPHHHPPVLLRKKM